MTLSLAAASPNEAKSASDEREDGSRTGDGRDGAELDSARGDLSKGGELSETFDVPYRGDRRRTGASAERSVGMLTELKGVLGVNVTLKR